MFRKLMNAWKRFALLIGAVNTAVLLFIVYFAVVTPIGLLMRLLGKTALSRNDRTSFWERREEGENLERQF